jgi:colanic acid/amylovoran biosynthesis glycosyltransferase
VRLGLISSKYPFGAKEPFLDAELRALAPSLAALTVIPATPEGRERGYDGVPGEVVRLSLFGGGTVTRALRAFARRPLRALGALAVVATSGPVRVRAKNLTVFVKALAVADVARERRLDHLHAYWLSTPATVAWVAARVAGIGFSATAHRWDVYENNLAARKLRDATFVRTISARGRRDLLALTRGEPAKVHVVRLGVELPAPAAVPVGAGVAAGERSGAAPLRILCAAALVPVKGHADLLDALAALRARGVAFSCTLAGNGPERPAIAARIAALGLDGVVRMAGSVPHDRLLEELASGAFDVAVIASVERAGGLMEGVPVALIEAMAAGVAVVATDSGSIGELVDGESGLLVPHSDPAALADALARVGGDGALRERLRAAGRTRVEREFDLRSTSVELRALFALV